MARFPRRLRRSKTIDSLKTSEVHASMVDGSACDGGGEGAVEKVRRLVRIAKLGNPYPVPVMAVMARGSLLFPKF